MQSETFDSKLQDENNPALATLKPLATINTVTDSDPGSVVAIRTVNELNEFFTNHYRELYRRTHIMASHSTERAEEVLQALYLRMRAMLRHNPEGLHQPWAVVTTIARRLLIDDARRSAVRARHLCRLPEEDHLPDREPVDPSAEAEADAVASRVRGAVDGLDSRLHRIVKGVYFEGRAARSIARELGLSESRVAELKAEALARMRFLLNALSGGEYRQPQVSEVQLHLWPR